MHKTLIATSLAMLMAALPASAQQAPVETTSKSSEPGKVMVTKSVSASAIVTALDKSTRVVTLKRPDGQLFELKAGDEVKNFDQIAIGDEVLVEYLRAVSLNLKKGGGIREGSQEEGAYRAKPGDKPAGVIGRHVNIIADVIAVDPVKKTITLKGPKGNIVELEVQNPDHFKVVKTGDQVEADFIESLAIAVVPVKKK